MCDERERLIDYLYEEGDLRERAEVQAHLIDCATCREEIAALRAVRQDLMAWAVPAPDPIWRPLPVARAPLTWRDVPAWALAAAAAVVLMAGVSGAAAARFFGPGPAASVTTSGAPASQSPGSLAVLTATGTSSAPAATTLDIARVSRRLDEVEARLTRQVDLLASHQPVRAVPASMAGTSADVIQDLQRRLADTENRLDSQAVFNSLLDKKVSTAQRSARNDEGLLIRAGYNPGPMGAGR
jgi:anti-sigma factor RsiW